MDSGFDERIRRVLKELGMNQHDLAARAGLPLRSVQHYVAGTQKPGADALVRIKAATGVSLDWLLAGEGATFSTSKRRPLSIDDMTMLYRTFTNFGNLFTVPKEGDASYLAIIRDYMKRELQAKTSSSIHPDFAALDVDVDELTDDQVRFLFWGGLAAPRGNKLNREVILDVLRSAADESGK